MQASDSAQEMLLAALAAIGHDVPAEGLAALRFWGQTGERSGAWMAAADPVHLEARLDHLRLHAFQNDDIEKRDLRELFNSLQALVADDGRFSFARLGPLAYLRSEQPITTAECSPPVIDGLAPDEFLPEGSDAAAHDRLLGELQMALHDHAVNLKRASLNQRTINSIWVWGGGVAPAEQERPIPPLFSDDPLFRGYWKSCSGTANFWMEEFDDVLNLAPDGFVAVAPDESAQQARLSDHLEDIRLALKRGDLRRITLLFRDGLTVELARSDAFRFWRRMSPLLENANDDA